MNSNRLQIVARFFLVPMLCAFIAVGCGSSGKGKLNTIAVTPATASIAPGATQQFKATGTYSDGSSSDITAQVMWSSGTASVATIGASTGLATGVAGGSSVITATLTGVSGTANLTVISLTSIAVTPNPASVHVGATVQFIATGTYSDNSTVTLTTQVAWSSGTTAVATIGAGTGLATGVTQGSSVITATLGAITGTATLNVASLLSIAITPNPASVGLGGAVQLTATGTFSDTTTANISSQVTWNSATIANATISSTGLATAVALGTSNITATLGAIVSPIDILTVTAPTLQSVTVSPANPAIGLGATADFTATGNFSDGSTVPLPAATWASGTTATATILANGIAVSQATGTSTITATFNGVNGTTLLTVQPAVARSAYVSGTTDSNTATYVLKTSPAAALPIASLNLSNAPSQAVPEPSGRFVYLLAANVIYTATVDPVSGRLTGVPSSLSTGVNGNFGVVDPTGQYLYVASSVGSTTTLDSYLIKLTDGSLSRIGAAGISVGTNLISVIVDRSGKYVFAIDNGGQVIFPFSIGAGGALTAIPGFFPTGNSPQYPVIDPTNTYLYVPDLNDGAITTYKINADGTLTVADGGAGFTVGIGSGPTFAAIDATDKYFYVTNQNDNTVSAVTIVANGALGPAVSGSPFATGVMPVGIAIDPTNSTVAVANVFGNSISAFTINPATGALTAAAVPQVETPAGPFFINLGIGVRSPNVLPGAVYAANSVSNDISAFTSTPATGALTAAANSPFPGIPGNSFAAADLQGSLFFAGSGSAKEIAGFSVNQSSAALTALTGSPLSITGTDTGAAVYIFPTDSFAYSLDTTTGSLVANAISGTTVTGPGAVTSAFTGANNIAADPQGDLIYALGSNSTSGIQPYTTIQNSGVLIPSTQTALPGNWTSGAVDASSQFLVAVDSTAKTLQSFSITPVGPSVGTDGALTPVAASGSVTLTGAGPWVVAFDPQDRAVFVADQTAGTITPYAFTYSTGALGAAGTSVTVSANGLTNITVDLTGTYLYAGVNAPAAPPNSKGSVAVYTIGSGGALTAVAGSPFTAGTGNPGVAATNVVQ
jgi:6-phosphogluconolactonase (cycloisomerase 2 family)